MIKKKKDSCFRTEMYKLIATVLSILASGVVVAENEVNLKAEVVEVIFLECKINGIVWGVEFITPQGSSYGSCSPPVPPEIDKNTPIPCGNNITQYLRRNTTVLLLEKSEKWLGVWTCKHGHSHSPDTVNITRSVLGQDIQRDTSNGDAPCFPTCLLYILCVLLITIFVLASLVIIWKRRQSKDASYESVEQSDRNSPDQKEGSSSIHEKPKADTSPDQKEDASSKQEEPEDDTLPAQQKEIKDQHGECNLCKKATSFAFCSCQNFFCEICSCAHHRSNKTHHMVQTRHEFEYLQNKLQCKTCSEKTPRKVCKKCLDVYCKDCFCDHGSHSFKTILLYRAPPLRLSSEENIQIEQPILEQTLKLPLDNAVISGLACLNDIIVAAIDYEHCTLHVFNKMKLVFSQNLKMEPKALTEVGDGKIAISFAYEKVIRIFEIHLEKAVEMIQEKINLEHLGKPFSISFNIEHYAVEIGEGKRGFIAIIDKKGKEIKRILHNDYSFGYFTSNNIRLCLDMKKNCFYSSAIGKQSVYCVDFNGTIKWQVTVPSPRELLIVPTDPDDTHILFASNRGSVVYQLIGKDADFNKKNPEGRILELESLRTPECITYNKENKLFCVGMENGEINVYHFENGL